MRLYKKFEDKYYENEGYFQIVTKEIRELLSKKVDGINMYPKYESKVIEELNIMATKQVAYDATKALIEKGYREIGLITGAIESYHTKKRMQGYHRALFDARIPYNPCWTAEGDWSRQSGYHMAEQLVSQGIKAIFVMNDLMAWGVYDYAREKGYRIGEDLVLIGFDDRELCEVLYPPLSSMHLPLHEMGHRAAKLLVERLEEEKAPEKKEYYIDCKLISRG